MKAKTSTRTLDVGRSLAVDFGALPGAGIEGVREVAEVVVTHSARCGVTTGRPCDCAAVVEVALAKPAGGRRTG